MFVNLARRNQALLDRQIEFIDELERGEEDPDRLFFERALVMEGDTELGLVLKNTLDAIGPLWPGWVPFGPAR